MHGIQKISYTHAFKYYDGNRNLLRAIPATKQSTRESAESIADKAVERIVKIDIILKRIDDEWKRKDFTYNFERRKCLVIK